MSALPSVGRADAAIASDSAGLLYERYSRRIFAYCVTRLGSREEAEDATQTTFLNAFRSLQSGVVPQFELAWLFRIAENVCRDGHKSTSRRRRVESTRDLQDVQDIVSAPPRHDDGLVGLGAALAEMPERQRRAILLREWRGLSYGEIATELGLSRAAVETLIFRARRALARGLETPQPRRRISALNVLSLLGAAKSALQGAAAAKVVAAAVAVGSAAVVVAVPLGDGPRPAHPGAARPAPAPLAPSASDFRSTPRATSSAPAAQSASSERRPPASGWSRDARRGRAAAPPPTRASARDLDPASPTASRPEAGSGPSAPAATVGGEAPSPTPPAPTPPAPVASPPAPPAIVPEIPGVPDLPPVLPPPPLEVPLPLPEPPPLELPALPPLPPLP